MIETVPGKKEEMRQLELNTKQVAALREAGECELFSEVPYEEGAMFEAMGPGGAAIPTTEEVLSVEGVDSRPVVSAGMIVEVESVEIVPKPNPPVKGDLASQTAGPLYRVKLRTDRSGPRISIEK